jgi:hypothetical protein
MHAPNGNCQVLQGDKAADVEKHLKVGVKSTAGSERPSTRCWRCSSRHGGQAALDSPYRSGVRTADWLKVKRKVALPVQRFKR